MIAVDTNILVYARRAVFPNHDAAIKALTRLAEGDAPWGIPLFCALEFIRVVTHRKLFDPPTPPDGAVRFLDALLASPSGRLLLPNQRFWRNATHIVDELQVIGNDVFDAGIAACCISIGAREILTEDRDFERYSGVTPVTLDTFLKN